MDQPLLLSDDWLLEAIGLAGWTGDAGSLRTVDRTADHRLVRVACDARAKRRRAQVLHGFDEGVQFWIRVYETLSRVEDAIGWLKPRAVVRAEAKGKRVVRQGDWFFIACPAYRPQRVLTDVRYGRHTLECWSEGRAKGWVRHGEHDTLWLDGWHLPCRCRGWHSFSGPPRVRSQSYWVRHVRAEGAGG